MEGEMFRDLTHEDVELRVQRCNEHGCTLLIYKTSRVDMDLLDETVGPSNWQCRFYEQKGTLFCSIGIKTDNGWVWKSNAGAPSNMEAQKGEASDAMKRAGFCWGIGRELYTAPNIWVPAPDCNLVQRNGKWQCYDRFEVEKMKVEEGRITGLSVVNKTIGRRVYVWVEDADG